MPSKAAAGRGCSGAAGAGRAPRAGKRQREQGPAAGPAAKRPRRGGPAPPEYSKVSYWESRYRKVQRKEAVEETEEWLMDYATLRPLLRIARGAAVLDVGCGVSAFLADARKSGHKGRLVGIDFSRRAVEVSRERYGGVAGLEIQVGDARRMPFADASFDLVLDKATMDGQLCGARGLSPRGPAAQTAAECARVLRPGGLYCVVTWRGPGRSGGLDWLEQVLLPAVGGPGLWRAALHSVDDGRGDVKADRAFGRHPNVWLFRKRRVPALSQELDITEHVHAL
eukprot:TRINITY_DN30847_c0_g1_i1.p1 TRINITY_DN30847_c0_g1~~TRINITY_DN30847_c0_g1_i1.p1  ORF type:complete len:305 (+),score=88.15 TRINITY_DN30847_c0_g1_i1:70-915(+)